MWLLLEQLKKDSLKVNVLQISWKSLLQSRLNLSGHGRQGSTNKGSSKTSLKHTKPRILWQINRVTFIN